MTRNRPLTVLDQEEEAQIPIWKEALFGAELLLLHASPVYYGFGVPHGRGEAVVVIPGFLGTDLYLSYIRSWLTRIGYTAYMSGLDVNAGCPNMLIEAHLNDVISRAAKETGGRVHLVGHSLGGVMARAVARQRTQDVASVITIAAPFRGAVAHKSILRAAHFVRDRILAEHGRDVMPQCYTPQCTCDFIQSLHLDLPKSVAQTAIYTLDDGVVDWHYCMTDNLKDNFAVSGTHIGMVFNASVYKIIADRLAAVPAKRARTSKRTPQRRARAK